MFIVNFLTLVAGATLGRAAAITANVTEPDVSPVPSNLVARGGCDQGQCPDFYAGFDTLRQYLEIRPSDNWTRINDCGQCQRFSVSLDMCADFTSCGRPQNICVDFSRKSAHRIWKDRNQRSCYEIRDAYNKCGQNFHQLVYYPHREIPCTW